MKIFSFIIFSLLSFTCYSQISIDNMFGVYTNNLYAERDKIELSWGESSYIVFDSTIIDADENGLFVNFPGNRQYIESYSITSDLITFFFKLDGYESLQSVEFRIIQKGLIKISDSIFGYYTNDSRFLHEISGPDLSTELYHSSGIIVKKNLPLREYPDKMANVITEIPINTGIEVFMRTKDIEIAGESPNFWYYVKLEDDSFGWLYGAFIEFI